MKSKMLTLAALTAVSMFAAHASAATYKASDDFLHTYDAGTFAAGPGTFAFGYNLALDGAPAAFDHAGTIGTGVFGLFNNTSDFTPGVFYNHTGGPATLAGTVNLDDGQMAMHPGVNGEYSIVQFTAPSAGTFYLNALFTDQAAHPSATTDIHLYVNHVAGAAGSLSGSNHEVDLSGNYFLNAGESLAVYVGKGTGGYGSDTSALLNGGITVTSVPTPAALYGGTALLTGLGLAQLKRLRK